MIHVFHGFLGSPSDFEFLKPHGNVWLHDLYQKEEMRIHPEDTLIGYSLGGRIALELAHQNNYQFKRLVLINAHPGLPKPSPERSHWEESVLEKLSTLPSEKFLEYWNGLPLFKGDAPLRSIPEERYRESRALFADHRLSNQPCYLPDLEKNQDKVLSLSGLRDEKYSEVARELIEPCGVKCLYLEGGHRLFQNQNQLLEVLKSEQIL
jgi:2-succinyl-6-hydroxy-2,4-cyclohexadiene-1-carboxylate synthase